MPTDALWAGRAFYACRRGLKYVCAPYEWNRAGALNPTRPAAAACCRSRCEKCVTVTREGGTRQSSRPRPGRGPAAPVAALEQEPYLYPTYGESPSPRTCRRPV